MSAKEPGALTTHIFVVGYDRTPSSRHAVQWATKELQGQHAKLVIVHACRPLHAPSLSTSAERSRFGKAMIDELLLEGEDEMFDIDIETAVADENPVTALIDAAYTHSAEAIVIGSEPHSLLRKALGTVSSQLHENSPVPVIVVPADAAPFHSPN